MKGLRLWGKSVAAVNKNHRWGLILGGGEGKRLQPFITKLYGVKRAKQFCSIVGTRTMLEHTLHRMKRLIPFRQILTIITGADLKFVSEQLMDQPLNTVIVQPCRRDTALGILLPLLHINHLDPHALVAIFPSDQFILEERRFMEHVEGAFKHISRSENSIVLMGIAPSQVEMGYGWIQKGAVVDSAKEIKIHRVNSFCEKPDSGTAEGLFTDGWLWNSLVLVGVVSTLLEQIEKAMPEVFSLLSSTITLYNPAEQESILNAIYPSLPSINYSTAILEKCADQLCVLEVSDVYWSDWGSESRILKDVDKLQLTLHYQEGSARNSSARDAVL